MTHRSSMLLCAVAAFVIVSMQAASAQERLYERPYTPTLACAAVKALVAQRGQVTLATSPMAYETVYRDSGACREEVTARPAFEPTLDDPYCFAGWRCRQRDNDGTGTR